LRGDEVYRKYHGAMRFFMGVALDWRTRRVEARPLPLGYEAV
jgi:hypothetical protein